MLNQWRLFKEWLVDRRLRLYRPGRLPVFTSIKEVSEEEFILLAQAANFNEETIRNMVDYSTFQATAYQVGGEWLRITGRK